MPEVQNQGAGGVGSSWGLWGWIFSLSLSQLPMAYPLASASSACRIITSVSAFTHILIRDWDPSKKSMSLLVVQKPYLHIRSHSELLGVMTLTYIFWGNTTQSITPFFIRPSSTQCSFKNSRFSNAPVANIKHLSKLCLFTSLSYQQKLWFASIPNLSFYNLISPTFNF